MKHELGNELIFIDEGTGRRHTLVVTSVIYNPSTGEMTAIAEGSGVKVELKNDWSENKFLPDSDRYEWEPRDPTDWSLIPR